MSSRERERERVRVQPRSIFCKLATKEEECPRPPRRCQRLDPVERLPAVVYILVAQLRERQRHGVGPGPGEAHAEDLERSNSSLLLVFLLFHPRW